MSSDGIRPATAADVASVRAVTEAAYRPYTERIGVVPAPMEADHAADVAAGRVFVTGDPVAGVLVLVRGAGHLLLESVAVAPDARGTGSAAGSSLSPRCTHGAPGSARCGCIRTR